MFVYHFEADHYYYTSDEEVVATLYVNRGKQPAEVRVLRGWVVAEDGKGQADEEETLTFAYYEGNPVLRHRGNDPRVIWYEYRKNDRPISAAAGAKL